MAQDRARILISAEDKTREAFTSVQRNLGQLQDKASQLGGLFARLGVGLSLAGIAASFKSVTDNADEMGKLAQKTGVAVEELSKLDYAAKLSDVSREQLATGLQKLSRNMIEAAAGTGEAAKAFAELKIDPNQFTSADQAFKAIAEKFAELPDGAKKTALSMQLLGKSGAELIPLLNGGAAGLKSLGDEAKRLGLIISEDMKKAAEEFNDNMTRFGLVLEGVKNDAVKPLLPIMGELGRSMAAASLEARDSEGGYAPLKTILEALIITGANVKFVFEGIGRSIGGLAAKTAALASGDLAAVRAINREMVADNEAAKKSLEAFENRIFNPTTFTTVDQMLADQNKGLLGGAGGSSGSSARSKAGGKKKTQGPIDVFDNGAYITKNKEVADFIRSQQEIVNDLDRNIFKEKSDAAKQAEEAAARLKEKYIDLIYPIQKYREQLDEVDKLQQSGAISADQANEARFKINDAIDAQAGFNEQVKETNDIGKELGLTFSSAFEDAIVSGKKFSDVLKSLAQDVLKIFVRKSITEPLASGASKLFSSFDWSSLIPSANGNVFSSPGLSAYSGQIVSKPTVFPFANGIGLMGEAGPEAIMPLKRGADGKLGVQASGGGVMVNNYYTIDARGADAGVEQRIRRAMAETEERSIEGAVSQVQNLNQRGQLKLS